MVWYGYIAGLAIISQVVFIIQMIRNYHYGLVGPKHKGEPSNPKTLLTIPCKGIDKAFEKNINSFYKLDYPNYFLWFVVGDTSDPAYNELLRLKDLFAADSKAADIKILVSGPAAGCSQKIHNLLFSCDRAPADVEVFAFADSDACVKTDWLAKLVFPLQKSRAGASSGYRWYVPEKNNLATLALSAINAKITQLLGSYRFNQAWGGSMAIKADVFRKIGLDKIWQKAVSDDLTLSYAVKKAGLKVIFVPSCIVATYETTTWGRLFEFARRQFMITRVTASGTWWFGLFGSLYSILGLWGGTAVAVYAAAKGYDNWKLFAAVPVLFFASQTLRAVLRQKLICGVLKDELPSLKPAIWADLLGSCIWSLLLLIYILSSAFGRTIKWRGIKYKLVSPTETIVVN